MGKSEKIQVPPISNNCVYSGDIFLSSNYVENEN